MSANPLTPHGGVPEYVPPHLRGKVWDFRTEQDGSTSFQHPEAALGLSPQFSRVTLSPEQYKQTFDPIHRGVNFATAMSGQYAPLQRRPKSSGQQMGEMVGSHLSRAYDWGTSSQGKAVGTAGLLSALAGGVGGYLWSGRDGGEGSIGTALLAALVAGGLGAGGTALSQNKHNRREAWLSKQGASQDITQLLIRALENDPTLSGTDRATILRAATRLDTSGQQNLARIVRSAVGAGVGALVMRFLGGKGLLPMLAGGILGGMIGGRQPGLVRNAMGQVSITNYL